MFLLGSKLRANRPDIETRYRKWTENVLNGVANYIQKGKCIRSILHKNHSNIYFLCLILTLSYSSEGPPALVLFRPHYL